MPTLDRYWWLALLVSLPLAALAVTLPVWVVLAQSANAGAQLYVTAALMLLLLLGLALVLALKSVSMRHRALARTRAIHGADDAMPLSTVVPDDSDLPDLTTEPVIFEWRATRAGRAVLHWALLWLNLTVSAGALLVATLPHASAPADLPIDWPPTSGDLTIVGWLLFIPLFSGLYLVLRGRQAAIVATNEGVTRVPIIGRMKTVWWEDARLLEVSGSGRDVYRSRRYALYGRRSMVWWDERLEPGNMLTWDGVDASEGEARSEELVGVIQVRTGLAPRTFVRWLQQQPEPKKHGQVALGDALMYAVLAVGAIGIAAVVLLVPLSASSPLNAIVAAPFGAFALVFLMQALGRLGDFFRRAAASQWELLYAPATLPPASADETYLLTYSTPLRRKVSTALAGLLLVVELLPLWLVDIVNPLSPDNTVFPPHPALGPLDDILACMLIPFGAAGVFVVITALRSGQRTITAGPFGLELHTRNRATIIDWYEVEVFSAIMRRGRSMGYRVTRKLQGTDPTPRSIYWPATLVGTAAPNAISGDELAALVVQCSGKSIQVR